MLGLFAQASIAIAANKQLSQPCASLSLEASLPYMIFLLSGLLLLFSMLRNSLEKHQSASRLGLSRTSAFSLIRSGSSQCATYDRHIQKRQHPSAATFVATTIAEPSAGRKTTDEASSYAVPDSSIDGFITNPCGDLVATITHETAEQQACAVGDQSIPIILEASENSTSASGAFDDSEQPDRIDALDDAVDFPSVDSHDADVVDSSEACAIVCTCDGMWGCASHCTYSSSLLLAHRVVSVKIAQGPPGLTLGGVMARESSSLRALKVGDTFSHMSMAEPAIAEVATLEAFAIMDPPTSKCKLLLAFCPGLSVHVNSGQRRYQVYHSGKEITSLSWGVSSATKRLDVWAQLSDVLRTHMRTQI